MSNGLNSIFKNPLLLHNKIEEYNKYFILEDSPKKEQAIITLFVYKDLTSELLSMVKLFIETHLKFNSKAEIIIFTNFVKEVSEDNLHKNTRILYFPYAGEEFMTQRVLFNVCAIRNFFKFKKIFILDTDLVAIKPYSRLKAFEEKYDIGLTFHNEWLKKKEFPINAGFFICNNENLEFVKLISFCEGYLNSYIQTIKFQKELYEKKLIEHDKNNLAEWYGDQYLYFILLPTQLDTKIKIVEDFQNKGINYRLFNDRFFNFAPMALKKGDLTLNLKEIFDEKLSYTFFLHLKGNRKKFINNILSIVKKL